MRLYGPGDVTGIDPQQVVRTEPRHLATDFEPNYFPAIEFDRPDFPWLFTPAKANADGKLRPWLCLVVVRKQEGVSLRVDRNLPLPVLEIKPPARPERELPDLSESWAWAHAQVAGSRRDAGSLKQSLAGDPALTVSRLLCPRRLDPLTDYLACVVPAFGLGCKAGLGLPIEPADEQPPLGLAPAWVVRRAISRGCDFAGLFSLGVSHRRRRRFRSAGAIARGAQDACGSRQAADGHQSARVHDDHRRRQPGTTLELEGALRVPDAPTAEWPEETRKPFQADLKKILDAPWQAMKRRHRSAARAADLRQLASSAAHGESSPPAAQTWLDELNLDPRSRVVAALGTRVVQTEQEQLMASAWEQLGEIQRINQMRRQAQLGRAVNAVYHTKHFTPILRRNTVESRRRGAVAHRRRPTTVDNAADNHDAVAARFRNRPSRPGRLRAIAPLDKPAQCHQHSFPHARRAAHQHRGQAERHDRRPASKERSRLGDDQPGFRSGGIYPRQ